MHIKRQPMNRFDFVIWTGRCVIALFICVSITDLDLSGQAWAGDLRAGNEINAKIARAKATAKVKRNAAHRNLKLQLKNEDAEDRNGSSADGSSGSTGCSNGVNIGNNNDSVRGGPTRDTTVIIVGDVITGVGGGC